MESSGGATGPEDRGPRQVPEEASSRKGIAQFLGINLEIWAIVIVLALVFLAVILWVAL